MEIHEELHQNPSSRKTGRKNHVTGNLSFQLFKEGKKEKHYKNTKSHEDKKEEEEKSLFARNFSKKVQTWASTGMTTHHKEFKPYGVARWNIRLTQLKQRKIDLHMGSQVNQNKAKKKLILKRITRWDLRLTQLKPRKSSS